LGRGSFGTVFLAHNYETHNDYALKVFNKNLLKKDRILIKDESTGKMTEKSAYDDALKEIKIMKTLDN